MKRFIIAVIALIGAMQISAQNEILMTINGEPVTKAEFEYIYNKNNSDNAIDKKTLDEYVDLFVNFKLNLPIIPVCPHPAENSTWSFALDVKLYWISTVPFSGSGIG